jgi:hypothetical protein
MGLPTNKYFGYFGASVQVFSGHAHPEQVGAGGPRNQRVQTSNKLKSTTANKTNLWEVHPAFTGCLCPNEESVINIDYMLCTRPLESENIGE